MKSNNIIWLIILIVMIICITFLLFNDPEINPGNKDNTVDTTDSNGTTIIDQKDKTLSEITSASDPAIREYFAVQLRDQGIDKIGEIPIEGFTPSIYKQAFPGLIDEDFDNVAGYGGIWKMQDGELKFIRDIGEYITSGDGALVGEGTDKLLSNLESRLSITADSRDVVDEILRKIS